MSYEVKTIAVFEKQAKRLIKKYGSLKNELTALVQELKEKPETGTSLGKNCYKIRLFVAAKGKGKRGGARIITNVVITHKTVYLLSVYDKSEIGNISDKQLSELLKFIPD